MSDLYARLKGKDRGVVLCGYPVCGQRIGTVAQRYGTGVRIFFFDSGLQPDAARVYRPTNNSRRRVRSGANLQFRQDFDRGAALGHPGLRPTALPVRFECPWCGQSNQVDPEHIQVLPDNGGAVLP